MLSVFQDIKINALDVKNNNCTNVLNNNHIEFHIHAIMTVISNCNKFLVIISNHQVSYHPSTYLRTANHNKNRCLSNQKMFIMYQNDIIVFFYNDGSRYNSVILYDNILNIYLFENILCTKIQQTLCELTTTVMKWELEIALSWGKPYSSYKKIALVHIFSEC